MSKLRNEGENTYLDISDQVSNFTNSRVRCDAFAPSTFDNKNVSSLLTADTTIKTNKRRGGTFENFF